MNEKQVLALKVLRDRRTEFVSPTNIARYAFPEKGHEWADNRGSAAMSPACLKLVEAGLSERNARGKYMITAAGLEKLLALGE
ncbi:hypothetical protein ACLBWT_18865 [Paenibacillus sp. D51F]